MNKPGKVIRSFPIDREGERDTNGHALPIMSFDNQDREPLPGRSFPIDREGVAFSTGVER
jgi:hypothetical protein